MKRRPGAKAAIYARLAVKYGKKIDRQIHSLTMLIRENGDRLMDTYIDNGVSGSPFQRPGFRQLLRAAKQGAFTKLYLQDISRLSREQVELITAYEWLKRRGVVTIVIKNPEGNITL